MFIKHNSGVDGRGTPYTELVLDNISIRVYTKNTYIQELNLQEGERTICIVKNSYFFKSPIKWLLPIVFIKDKKLVERELAKLEIPKRVEKEDNTVHVYKYITGNSYKNVYYHTHKERNHVTS